MAAARIAGLLPPFRIAVDVGGTFTDLALQGVNGAVAVVKVPTVPADPSRGVLHAVAKAASERGISTADLLGDCELFVHGSTIAANTLLEGRGAVVGMLTTFGFRDSLEIRRGIRENQWDHRRPFPPVLVPRYLRRPVHGRIDSNGAEIEELREEDVLAAIEVFEAEGVESVAVCLFNSYLDPVHEKRCAEILGAHWSGGHVTVSSAVLPAMGEYGRGSTAVANAFVGPRVMEYLEALAASLAEEGLEPALLLLQSNGGAISLERVAARPVFLLLSGPAAGAGALELVRRTTGTDDLLSMEIGGTSCDVLLMAGGRVPLRDTIDVAGYRVSTPSVDLHTVGAGGGTIAGVDGAGLLFCGPHGAGADPGPACFGLGGEQPTVTDAQLVLGRMREGSYAGGAVTLARQPAERSIERCIAEPLEIDLRSAAVGIVELLEQRLQHAVERLSLERGIDPRRFTLVAAGGAGPLHAVSVARRLGIRQVYIPRMAGGYCALGMLHSNVRHDLLRVFLAPLGDVDRDGAEREGGDPEGLESVYRDLESQAAEELEEEGFESADRRTERRMDLRYRGQQWSVTVALSRTDSTDLESIRSAFEGEHDRLFGHIQPGGDIEITALRLIAEGVLGWRDSPELPQGTSPPDPMDRRSVFLGGHSPEVDAGWQEVPIYLGSDLQPGHRVEGPMIVEEETTTVLVGVEDELSVDRAGNFLITVGGLETHDP